MNGSLDDLKAYSYRDYLGDDVCHVSVEQSSLPIVYGYGSHYSPTTARLKAINETAERLVVAKEKRNDPFLNSNGFASHFSRDLAEQMAEEELIERDLFLNMWFSRIPPMWLDIPKLYEIGMDSITSHISLFKEAGLIIRLGVIGRCNGTWVTLAFVYPYDRAQWPFGVILTPSGSSSLRTSLEKAVMDQRRIITKIKAHLKNNNKEFLKKNDQIFCRPLDHLRYYLNRSHAKSVWWLLEGQCSDELPVFPDVKVQFQSHGTITIDLLRVTVVRAYSNDVHQYFVGKTEGRHINWNRFNQIYSGLSPSNQIHPLG